MKIALIILGVIVGAVALFAIYRYVIVYYQNNQLNAKRVERVRELVDRLEKGSGITAEDVLPFARNLLTRETTYRLLHDFNRTELFPAEYYSLLKGAESHLANWLEFPTELDACPDEMEHIKRVTFDFDGENHLMHYEVFKYRTHEPHWAAKDGWYLGVVGPYFDDSKPYDFAGATFSRMSSVEQITPEEEAKWVHENIVSKH